MNKTKWRKIYIGVLYKKEHGWRKRWKGWLPFQYTSLFHSVAAVAVCHIYNTLPLYHLVLYYIKYTISTPKYRFFFFFFPFFYTRYICMFICIYVCIGNA